MKKILIVDDQAEQRGFLVEAMKMKCKVFETGQADEALRIFLEERPDGVSLDYDLGGPLRGDHLLKLMKCKRPEIPIIMVTGYSHLKKELLSQGADEFMEKPVQLADFFKFFVRKGLVNGNL